MDEPSGGRWRWFDTVILAAVVAAGLGAAVAQERWNRREDPLRWKDPIFPSPAWKRFPRWVRILCQPSNHVEVDVVAFLTVANLGLPLVTVRRGRLRNPSGWPGPGVAATLAAGSLLGISVLNVALQLAFWSSPPPAPGTVSAGYLVYFLVNRSYAEINACGAVLGAWVVLAAAGRWVPRPDWPDRLGRWVGWGWVGCTLWRNVVWLILWG